MLRGNLRLSGEPVRTGECRKQLAFVCMDGIQLANMNGDQPVEVKRGPLLERVRERRTEQRAMDESVRVHTAPGITYLFILLSD